MVIMCASFGEMGNLASCKLLTYLQLCYKLDHFRSPNIPKSAAAEPHSALPHGRRRVEPARLGGPAAASASRGGVLRLGDADERLEQRLAHLHDQLGGSQQQQQQSQQLQGSLQLVFHFEETEITADSYKLVISCRCSFLLFSREIMPHTVVVFKYLLIIIFAC